MKRYPPVTTISIHPTFPVSQTVRPVLVQSDAAVNELLAVPAYIPEYRSSAISIGTRLAHRNRK
jgi:hypothetical protein